MKSKKFNNVRIGGICCALPANKVLTDSYMRYFNNHELNKFKLSTGINASYRSKKGQTGSDLCFIAADALMKEKQLTGEEIDALVYITQSPDYRAPATSYTLHNRLNIKNDCIVFDMNLGCSAFVVGVYTLAGLIESGAVERALLLIGDSFHNKPGLDISNTLMFGDSGSAVIIGKGEGLINGMIRSDGSGFNMLIAPVPGARFLDKTDLTNRDAQPYMRGDDVFSFTITKVPKLFKEFYKCFDVGESDFDYYMLHQANKMIVEYIAKKLKINPEKAPLSLVEYGNTVGSSIPLGIVDLCQNITDERNALKLICSGFGIGLSWGIVSFDLYTQDVLPPLFTDYIWEEGRNVYPNHETEG